MQFPVNCFGAETELSSGARKSRELKAVSSKLLTTDQRPLSTALVPAYQRDFAQLLSFILHPLSLILSSVPLCPAPVPPLKRDTEVIEKRAFSPRFCACPALFR